MILPVNFWESQESLILLNPKLSSEERSLLEEAARSQKFHSTIWLKSSGTESGSGGHKLVCLSKQAFLASAKAVNDFFKVTSQDYWLNPLPLFHVGGLSVLARAHLAEMKTDSMAEWNCEDFVRKIKSEKVTISSLVPTQVYDLVEKKIQAPASLRFILVGGGPLDKDLYVKARELGWPLLPSYGMTETCAVMASAKLESLKSKKFPNAHLLSHIEVGMSNGRTWVRGPSLFDGFLWIREDQKMEWQERDEPFFLDDRLEIQGDLVRVTARESEIVKILGETVNIQTLQIKLKKILDTPCVVLPVESPRLGFELNLFLENNAKKTSVAEINQRLLPYERISKVFSIENFPTTELGKINRSELLKLLE